MTRELYFNRASPIWHRAEVINDEPSPPTAIPRAAAVCVQLLRKDPAERSRGWHSGECFLNNTYCLAFVHSGVRVR